MSNQIAAPADDGEEHEAARYSRSNRLAATLARLDNHGSATHDALGDTVRTNFNSTQPMSYNAHTQKFSVNGGVGGVFSEAEMQNHINQAEVPYITDDGRNTNAERGRLQSITAELKGRLATIDGYDTAGKPLYRLTGYERIQVEKFLKDTERNHEFAFDELQALDEQRSRHASIKASMAAEDTAREERIDAYTAEAIERQEAEERARKILAARKKVIW